MEAPCTDDQMRRELFGFFQWEPDAILKLSHHELSAWKRHVLALRAAGFWWEKESV